MHKTNTLVAPQIFELLILVCLSLRGYISADRQVRTGYRIIPLRFWIRVSAEVRPQISPSRMACFVKWPSYLSQEGNRFQIPAPRPLAYWRVRFVGSATSATDQIRDLCPQENGRPDQEISHQFPKHLERRRRSFNRPMSH